MGLDCKWTRNEVKMGDLGLPSLAQSRVLACKYHKGSVIRFRHEGSRCEVGEGEDGGVTGL